MFQAESMAQMKARARLCPQWRRAGGRWGNRGHQSGSTLSLVEPGEPQEPQGVCGKMAVAKKGFTDSYCIDSRTTRLVPGSRPCHLGVSVVCCTVLCRTFPEHNLTHSHSSAGQRATWGAEGNSGHMTLAHDPGGKHRFSSGVQ